MLIFVRCIFHVQANNGYAKTTCRAEKTAEVHGILPTMLPGKSVFRVGITSFVVTHICVICI